LKSWKSWFGRDSTCNQNTKSQRMLIKFIFVEKYHISAFWNRLKLPHMIFLLFITTISRKRMVDTSLKSWDIIFYAKHNLVNTCWLHDAIFLLSRNFLEILKNQYFYDFTTSPTIENSQQLLTKITFVEKYDISALWIPIERNSRILQTHSTISSRFPCFFWKIRVKNQGNFFHQIFGQATFVDKMKTLLTDTYGFGPSNLIMSRNCKTLFIPHCTSFTGLTISKTCIF